MNYRHHLLELRTRIINSLLFTVASFCVCYYYIESITFFLSKPIVQSQDIELISTGIAETFFSYLSFAIKCSIGSSMPFYLFQIYCFAKPGLYKKEKGFMNLVFIGFLLMFIAGALFMYYLVLPNAMKFLVKYQTSEILQIKLHAKISELTATILHLIIGFGVAFQMPIILIILVKYNVISAKKLRKTRRFAIVGIFTFAAFATPPDILSQIVLASVMIILYEITILICIKIKHEKQ